MKPPGQVFRLSGLRKRIRQASMESLIKFILVAAVLAAVNAAVIRDQSTSRSSSEIPFGTPGYIEVNEERGHHMFYWFVPSENTTTNSFIFWMNGGPGASSVQNGFFYENGPFSVDENLTVEARPYSWHKFAHVLYVDQPVGVGWSYGDKFEDKYDIRTDVMMKDMVEFIVKFFEQYPQYLTDDFFIFGESYGGHYGPALAQQLLEYNKQEPKTPIPLKGLALGDGFVDPLIQYPSYVTFSTDNDLIGKDTAKILAGVAQDCVSTIDRKQYVEAAVACNGVVGAILAENPGMSFYDIRLICKDPLTHDCYDMEPAVKYMEQIRQKLTVRSDMKWGNPGTVDAVIAAVIGDEDLNFRQLFPGFMEAGVRVMMYHGQYDFACNYVGGAMVLDTLPWSGAAKWAAAETKAWNVGGNQQGTIRQLDDKSLTFMVVKDSGHMVPMDNPVAGFALAKSFVTNSWSE